MTRCRLLDLAELDTASVVFFNRGMAILAAWARLLSLAALRGDCGTRKTCGVLDTKDWLGARGAANPDRSGVSAKAGEDVEDSTEGIGVWGGTWEGDSSEGRLWDSLDISG